MALHGLRLSSTILSVCLAAAMAAPSAFAQPKLPKAEAPAAPEVPKAPSLPSLPTQAEVPPLPTSAPRSAPDAQDSAGIAPSQGPSATVDGPPEDIEIQVDDRKPEPSDGLPGTLPSPLRVRAKVKGVNVQQKGGGGLTIEEIVNPPVRSVSNHMEGALSAPAWVIHLSAKEIANRGYTDLSQVLDDLPGMDIIRPYGPAYARDYFRGYRSGTGNDPYVILLDGLPFSSLFFRDAQMMTAFPLSDIDHIEVVYGPASVANGGNASAGLINIVTIDGADAQQAGDVGSALDARITYGGAQRNLTSFADSTKIADVTARWSNKDLRVRFSARLERSVLDRSIGDDFEFTRDAYYEDPRIWGQGVLDTYPQLAGQFRSPDDKLAMDGRVWLGHFEFGGVFFSHTTGFGTMVPGDRFQTQPPWATDEGSAWIRHSSKLTPEVTTSTLLRYRQSNLSPPTSLLLRAAEPTGFLESGPRLLGLAVDNRAYELQQQFDIEAGHDLIRKGDQLFIELGLVFHHVEVSKGVRLVSNVFYPNGDPAAAMDQTLPSSGTPIDSRQYLREQDGAVYALGSYEVAEDHWLHVGGRVEHQTYTDTTALVLRGGYVGNFEPVTVKALYGEATQPPSPSDITLSTRPVQPRELKNMVSRSFEANATLTLDPFVVTVAGWKARYDDPIVDGAPIHSRDALGLDAGARMALRPFQVWLYYSHYFQAKEDPDGEDDSQPIGDLAMNKFWGGVTYDKANFTATLMGRFMGSRRTVVSNPVRDVDPYFTLDANMALKNMLFEGSSISLRCANLLDTQYAHPGVGTADSGDVPGVFGDDGGYVGSAGLFNSLHPQPRRSWFLTLGLAM